MTTKRNNKKRHLAVVGVIFNNNGEVLLTLRNEPRSTHAHGKWHLPGGGIDFGEHPIEALHREIKEETGIVIQLLSNHPLVHSHLYKERNIHALILSFPALYSSGTIDISKDRNTGDAKWFKVHEIDYSTCLPLVKEILQESQKFLNLKS